LAAGNWGQLDPPLSLCQHVTVIVTDTHLVPATEEVLPLEQAIEAMLSDVELS
jgi:hypothetical protein